MKKVLSVVFVLFTISVFAQEKIYTPTTVAPVDSAISQNVNVMLDWNPVSGVAYYEIQIDTSNTFSNPVLYTATYSAYNTSVLLFGQYYHWRVRAIDAVGDSSNWSVSKAFETKYRPTLSTPADSATGIAVNPLMKTTLLSGVTTYEWEFDSVNTFSSAWYQTGSFITGSTFSTVHNLYGDRYFWRVRGIHVNDTSDWSTTFSFLTKDSVGLKYPLSGTVDFHPVDSMAFYSIFGTTKYQMAFDTDSLFPSPFYTYLDSSAYFVNPNNGDSLASTHADTLPYGSKLYWKVRLMNPNDTSKWSNIWNLTTVDKVTMNAPADASIDIPVTSSFDWDAIRGTDYYILEYDTAATFATAIKVNVTGTTYTPTTLLTPQTDYYWRVRAANAKDTTDVWDEFSFTTYFGLSVEENSQIEWDVYPNPAYDYVNISIEGSNSAYAEVINILGDVVINSNNMRNGNNIINLGELDPGMYMIRLYIDDEIATTRLIKK
jgi:hypothetical protein